MDKFENSPKCEIQAQSSLPVPHNSLEKVNSRPCAQFLFNFPQRFPFPHLSIVVFLFPSSFFPHVLSFFFYSIFSIIVFTPLKLFLLRFLFNSLSSPVSTKFILLLLLLQLFVTNNHKKMLR